MDLIVLPLFFYKDGFGIKYPTQVDMLLNKDSKRNQTKIVRNVSRPSIGHGNSFTHSMVRHCK